MKKNQSIASKKTEGKDWDGICPNCNGSTFIVEVMRAPDYLIIKTPSGIDGALGWSDGDEFTQEAFCKVCGFEIHQVFRAVLQSVSFESPRHPQT